MAKRVSSKCFFDKAVAGIRPAAREAVNARGQTGMGIGGSPDAKNRDRISMTVPGRKVRA